MFYGTFGVFPMSRIRKPLDRSLLHSHIMRGINLSSFSQPQMKRYMQLLSCSTLLKHMVAIVSKCIFWKVVVSETNRFEKEN